MRLGPTLLSARRAGAYAVLTSVWPRLRTAQGGRHLAIVDPLFVARLAAQPFLGGAGRFDAARFAVGTPCRIGRGQRDKKEKRPRNDAAWSTQHHRRRIGYRRNDLAPLHSITPTINAARQHSLEG
jgi:hypothetical protein